MSDEAPSEPHAPVKGLRVMAVLRWILLAVVAAVAIGSWAVALAPEDHHEGAARYYCPMHPEIRDADPGTCPICFMNLEPIPAGDVPLADAGTYHEEPELTEVMLTTERRQRAGIASVPARRRTIAGEERWPASIEASEGARGEVRVRSGAFVERALIRDLNVEVRAGQPMAHVYSPEIVRAQEELLVARRMGPEVEAAGRERLILLGMSAREVDAMLASGRARRTITLRAPISGYVTRLEAVVGTFATPEMVLYEITDLSRVRVVATPFTSELAWLTPGARAQFVARGGAPVDVVFDRVEPAVTEGTRTLRARFTSEEALRPGEIGEVVLARPAMSAIVVPRDALIDTGTARYVFVERPGGLFEPRHVVAGELDGEDRVITSGVEEDERVVARGAFVLDSESRLQAALAPEPTE
jgi:Cu(I)/Ag(I) efflux system membrane fusion protein